jgi:predicted P-loop ATPase
MTSRVDFKQIAAAALASIDTLLNSWLPGGRRDGHEYKAINPTRLDNKPGSFSINMNTGVWADFADSDASGGDVISLYAYLHGLDQIEAAVEVAQQVGIEVGDRQTSKPRRAPAVAAPTPVAPKKAANWIPLSPVPDAAPPVPLAHIKRGKPDSSWAYHDEEGRLLGYIWRFTTSDGGKEIVPFTFCRHAETGAQEWRNVQFAEPRPLYVPGIDLVAGKTKLIVEGEKCADAAHGLVADRFDLVTWPGGGKALDKVDWSRFEEGDKVIVWPDCDAQREKLTKEEAEAGVDKDSKPLLPADKQPGVATAEKIAQKLIVRGCIVRIVDIPAPGEKPGGWDVADTIEEGWTGEQVKAFVLDRLRQPMPTGDSAESPKPIYTADGADAEDDAWRAQVFWKDGKLRECRENVFQLLQSHPDWIGCLAMDEFANVIKCRRDTPVGLKAGELWDEHQDFKLGLWMAQHLRLFIKSDGVISAGVRASAMENKFHPVRDWLDGLAWDGKPRIASWLSDYAGVRETEYTALAGMLFLIGMVARIYRPGCKMDTALILEGLQGEGKSSIARALAGEWFSDTTFVMGDKDSFLALRGRWAYELAELDSFNRSESTRAKAFISSSTDSYRAPYDRTTKDWPRQCVFIGTTNQYEYFKDSSGNRRYWPVMCSDALDVEGLAAMREQLFAEAVKLFRDDAQWWPTKEQQQLLFTPEQEMREVSDPWELAIHVWLMSGTEREVTALGILTGALKMEVSKIDGARQATMRVGTCMRKLGWPKKRRTSGAREWYYERPASATAPAPARVVVEGGDDDHLF